MDTVSGGVYVCVPRYWIRYYGWIDNELSYGNHITSIKVFIYIYSLFRIFLIVPPLRLSFSSHQHSLSISLRLGRWRLRLSSWYTSNTFDIREDTINVNFLSFFFIWMLYVTCVWLYKRHWHHQNKIKKTRRRRAEKKYKIEGDIEWKENKSKNSMVMTERIRRFNRIKGSKIRIVSLSLQQFHWQRAYTPFMPRILSVSLCAVCCMCLCCAWHWRK